MKENFKIIFCIGVVFLSSFLVLGLFLDAYSQGLLTSERNIISIGGIVDQNPKQVTLDVLQNILGDTKIDDVNINSLGFRGDEFEKNKPDNTFRIFLLGGSQIFGTGATSDNTTIPGYLQKYFDRNEESFAIEVINAGLKGIDSRKELLLLQNMILDFRPDLVIVYDGLNDLRAGNSSTDILDNWNSMCELGQKNNFDVMITLQPIAGFGKKSLTEEELRYVQNGKDFKNNSLIESFAHYEIYANSLNKLQNCSNKLDLRYIFDNELESIYIDEAHVSDKGNSIVAESLVSHISSSIPNTLILNQTVYNDNQKLDSDVFSEFEYVVETIFLNFEKKLLKTPFFIYETEILSQDSTQLDKITVKTESKFNKNNEIFIIIEIYHSQNESPNEKTIKIKTMSETNDSLIHNVTYLMTISKNGSELFTNYFFAEDELLIQVYHNDDKNIKISGERKYELDALIMKAEVPITISGSFFEQGNTYEFDISLRTIHNPENYIFLNGFHAEITP
ncbi:MAG: SGNH/GDSL hydrolase family protein [Candidatus Nitrosopelagicus sp.]|nr:SGNH/GDSL hydrolase family protein [Candidatus Nitrosopelagicus sp.]